jgi:hypothetical protein
VIPAFIPFGVKAFPPAETSPVVDVSGEAAAEDEEGEVEALTGAGEEEVDAAAV